MISAVAPPGMPIERGMTASRIQGPVNLGPGNMNKIMGCLARNANRPVARAIKIKHAGLSASRQFRMILIKKNNINKLQAAGGGPGPSYKQKNFVDAPPVRW